MALVIAQLSDLHLDAGADAGANGRDDRNGRRLADVLAMVREHAPDMLFVTGDLTEHGDPREYRRLAAALATLPCPVHLAVGNHDRRYALASVFPDVPMADGFVQYGVEHPALRCIVLDTLAEGRGGGAFCERRAAWLSARLAESARPTLILLHHPPVEVGLAWMDPNPGADWIARLHAAIAPHRHVVGLAAGHLHGASATGWHGIPVTVAPSVALPLALSLAAIHADRPDGRAIVVDGPPGFALHRWDGAQLTSHFVTVPGAVVARYDRKTQPMVRGMLAERSASP